MSSAHFVTFSNCNPLPFDLDVILFHLLNIIFIDLLFSRLHDVEMPLDGIDLHDWTTLTDVSASQFLDERLTQPAVRTEEEFLL